MQNAAGDSVAPAPQHQNDAYRAVVSDLVSLIEHVQNSLRLVEQMIARETSFETPTETSPASPESSTNIIGARRRIPRYMKTGAVLQVCHVNPGIALRSLPDASDSDPCAASLPATQSSGRSADAAPDRNCGRR